jgi:hypothetical protein
VDLAGRAADAGREETAIAPRTRTLDPWQAQALTAWKREKSQVRPVDPAASVLCSGNQPLTAEPVFWTG